MKERNKQVKGQQTLSFAPPKQVTLDIQDVEPQRKCFSHDARCETMAMLVAFLHRCGNMSERAMFSCHRWCFIQGVRWLLAGKTDFDAQAQDCHRGNGGGCLVWAKVAWFASFGFSDSLRFLGDGVVEFWSQNDIYYALLWGCSYIKKRIAGHVKHPKLNDTEEVNDIGKVCSSVFENVADWVSTQPCSISCCTCFDRWYRFPDFRNTWCCKMPWWDSN